MKLTVLVDNFTYIDQYYLGEPALSFYIESKGEKILFDTGYSDALLRNARAMGVDLACVDTVILSHGHNDHTRGLGYLMEKGFTKRPRLIAHPDALHRKEEGGEEIGMPYTREALGRAFELVLTEEPLWVTEEVLFLSEIPRRNDYENQQPIGRRWNGSAFVEDFLPDDSALAVLGEKGLSVVTGCSHSGISNIVEQARTLTGREAVHSVIGGFHLLEEGRQLEETAKYFERIRPEALYPCHCVSLAAKIRLAGSLPVRETGVSLMLDL